VKNTDQDVPEQQAKIYPTRPFLLLK